ncbi:MAG: hypothetical protein AAGI27_17715 [Pseudomonadota bacterium]
MTDDLRWGYWFRSRGFGIRKRQRQANLDKEWRETISMQGSGVFRRELPSDGWP